MMRKVFEPLFKLNIQHFAEKQTDSTQQQQQTDTTQQTTEEKQTQEQTDKTYSQSELDSQISKADQRAAERERLRLEKEFEQKLIKARDEAAEYAKLSEQEKKDKDFERREKELEEKMNKIQQRELSTQVDTDLTSNNLPLSLNEGLLALGESEKIKESIGKIKKDFDAAVHEAVKQQLRQKTPEDTTGGTSTNQGPVNLQQQVQENADKFRKFN